jgi:hypothetical protein
MLRVVAFLILLAIMLCAVAASDRDKPLIVGAHKSGAWDFNSAAFRQPGAANPDLLFAPCPVGPRNRPQFRSERKA